MPTDDSFTEEMDPQEYEFSKAIGRLQIDLEVVSFEELRHRAEAVEDAHVSAFPGERPNRIEARRRVLEFLIMAAAEKAEPLDVVAELAAQLDVAGYSSVARRFHAAYFLTKAAARANQLDRAMPAIAALRRAWHRDDSMNENDRAVTKRALEQLVPGVWDGIE